MAAKPAFAVTVPALLKSPVKVIVRAVALLPIVKVPPALTVSVVAATFDTTVTLLPVKIVTVSPATGPVATLHGAAQVAAAAQTPVAADVQADGERRTGSEAAAPARLPLAGGGLVAGVLRLELTGGDDALLRAAHLAGATSAVAGGARIGRR